MMKKFWKDYAHLCKESGKFYKEHWFGVIVFEVVTIAGTFAWLGRDEIKNQIKEKFSKEEVEELE